jgi:ubiquinone/menaquinone biosynthesis C-methylase UbiE/uncharacterized protein YbaR (Trm112 family)
MRESLLEFLACPDCGCESINMEAVERDGDEIISGVLTCSGCLSSFPITFGIPSLLPKNHNRQEDALLDLSLKSPSDTIQKSEMMFRDDHVPVYDALPSAQAQLEINFVLDELQLLDSQKYTILDMGCGTGRALLSLIPYSQNLIGVDFSRESLKLLQTKLDAIGNPKNVYLIHGDAVRPPLKSNTFNAIVCVQLLQSFPDAETRLAVFRQIYRIASSNTRFVLSVFYYSFLKQIRAKSIKDPSQDVYEREGLHLGRLYYHNYSIREITELLVMSGFKVLRKRGVNTPLTRRYGSVGANLEKLLKWSSVLTPISHWITVSAIAENKNHEI